jgi:hypothetical protein
LNRLYGSTAVCSGSVCGNNRLRPHRSDLSGRFTWRGCNRACAGRPPGVRHRAGGTDRRAR